MLIRVYVLLALSFSLAGTDLFLDFIFLPPKASAQNVRSVEAPKPRDVMETVKLTESQVNQIELIQRQTNAQFSEDFKKLQQLQQEMNVLLVGANASESQIREKYREVKTLMQKISDVEFESRLNTRAVLEPEQRLLYVQEMRKLRASYEKHFGETGASQRPTP